MASVEAKKGSLLVVWPEGRATFAIGRDAEKWALKVRYPRSLLDKLGVKAGSRVAVVGSFPRDFLKDLGERTGDVARGKPRKDSDLVFVAMGEPKDLGQLRALREALKPAGGIWVVWPKGRRSFAKTTCGRRAPPPVSWT